MSRIALPPKLRCKQSTRCGSVSLVLVLILALLVGTFAASVTSRASHERRTEVQHGWIATLETAIEAVARSGVVNESKIRLPVDGSPSAGETGRWIIIETLSLPDETQMYQATLFHNSQPGLTIRRPAENT